MIERMPDDGFAKVKVRAEKLVGVPYRLLDCAGATRAVLGYAGLTEAADALRLPLPVLREIWPDLATTGGPFELVGRMPSCAFQVGDIVLSRSVGHRGGAPSLHMHAIYERVGARALSSAEDCGVYAIKAGSIRGIVGVYRWRR